MKYEALLNDADAEGLTIKERPFHTYDGRIKGKNIYLRKGMTTTEKACVLAEELGHHYTAVGDILDMDITSNRKLERAGRLHAYNRMIGLIGIINAYEHGCRNYYEMAEFLDVTEDFLKESLECYRQKYGRCVTLDNYIIYFEPYLAVMERID